jgi:GxxExxY protein
MSQDKFIHKDKSYQIIGACMEVHNQLGSGFLEIVYKDALEIEFNKRNIKYEREKCYSVYYKGILLPHNFYADFVVFDDIIIEVKGVKDINPEHKAQVINYLKVSRNHLALLVNFGKPTLDYHRFVL